MGIADFGVDPSTGSAYQYSSQAFGGEVIYSSFQVYNASDGDPPAAGFQLNLMFIFILGGQQYVYWVQDVAMLDTSTNNLIFIDNIWNDTAAGSGITPSTVAGTGNGNYGSSSYGTWYYAFPKPGLVGNGTVDGPQGWIYMQMQAAVTTSNQPAVLFTYSDPATGGRLEYYDNATFLFAKGASIVGFGVDGNSVNPIGIPFDAEFIAGGPGGGSQTAIVASNARFYLTFWNGNNWQDPPSAYNFGCETAEGVTGALDQGAHDSNGTMLNFMTPGSTGAGSAPGAAYSESQVATLNFTDPTVTGTTVGYVYINQSKTGWVFQNGYANLVIYAGTYTLYESVGTGAPKALGTCTLPGGTITRVSASTGCSSGGGLSISSFTITPSPATVGQAMAINVAVSGGTSPYSYAYTGLPGGCTSTNSSAFSCVPTSPGTFSVMVTVTDSTGAKQTDTVSLTVGAGTGSLTVSLTVSKNPVVAGNPTTLTVTVTGGTAPFTYIYNGLPTGCTTSNSSSITCTPASTVNGSFAITVTVTDAQGRTGSISVTLSVSSSGSSGGAPTITTFVASPNPATEGKTVTFAAQISGGVGTVTYAYSGLPTGCSGTTDPLTCTPTVNGTYTVVLTASDSAGTSRPAQLTLVINPATNGGGNNGGGGGNNNPNSTTYFGMSAIDFYLVLILIVVVVVGVIVVALASRKSGPTIVAHAPAVAPAQSATYPPNYPSYAAQPQAPAPPATTPPAFCSRCGSAVESDFMFCRNCGNQINK